MRENTEGEEADVPQSREPDSGLDPRTRGPQPERKADARWTEPPPRLPRVAEELHVV